MYGEEGYEAGIGQRFMNDRKCDIEMGIEMDWEKGLYLLVDRR